MSEVRPLDARVGNIRGSVSEVNSKRLLALNLRKLRGEEFHFVPRSYVVLGREGEFEEFVRDFKASQAVAVLKHVARHHARGDVTLSGCLPADRWTEGIHGRLLPEIQWLPRSDVEDVLSGACVDVAMVVTKRVSNVLRGGGQLADVDVTEEEWSFLSGFSPETDLAEEVTHDVRATASNMLQDLPISCQLTLLKGNVWVCKPSLNGCGNGRGIVLLDRLPASAANLTEWVTAVGRGGSSGAQDALDGLLLQKLVEEPHLLDRNALSAVAGSVDSANCVPVSGCFQDESPELVVETTDQLPKACLFKYNLRLWVLASMASPPEIWLYRNSYVDLAAREFTTALDPSSHITNLFRSQRTEQRYFSLPDFAACLRQGSGRDLYHEHILPQARSILRNVFKALGTPPSSLLQAPTARLKRLGVDLLVDVNFRVWLLEINVLRNDGLKGAKGQPMKHVLAQRLFQEEAALKSSLAKGDPVPAAWENLGDLTSGM